MAKFFTLLTLLGLALLGLSQAKAKVLSANDVGLNALDDKDDVINLDDVLGEDLDALDDDDLDVVVENLVGGSAGDGLQDELDDFPLDDLDEDELKELVKAEDDIFVGELDVHIAKQHYLENKAVTSEGQGRRKRIAPLIGRAAFAIGRTLFRRFGRTHVTRSGSRVTQHYRGSGNYQTALRDFERMRPTDVTRFNGRISGQTGRVGNYRVTVRDGSSKGQSRPTMSVHREGNTDFTRKFRYD